MRPLFAIATIALCCAAHQAPTPMDQVIDIIKEFDAAEKVAEKQLQTAKTPEERKRILEKILPHPEEYATRFIALARKYPGEKAAILALTWVADNVRPTPEEFEKRVLPKAIKEAVDIVTTSYVKNEMIGEFCRAVAGLPGAQADEFLKRVLAESPHKPVQAQACFGIAALNRELSESVKPGQPADSKYVKVSIDHFKQIQERFGDLKVSDKLTLGDMAEREIHEMQHLGVGMVAPEAESKDLNGKPVKLSALRGKVVVLDFWDTACMPCRRMIPNERGLVKKMEGKPFELVSVSFDPELQELKDFIKREPMPWMHWYNGVDGPMDKSWNVKKFPTIYVIDAKGVIRYKDPPHEQLDQIVDKLVAEVK